MIPWSSAAGIAVLCFACSVSADVTYVSQTRYVEGLFQSAGPRSDAPDFGPWMGHVGFGGFLFDASQSSALGASGVEYSGTVFADRSRTAGIWSHSTATSMLDVVFSLDETTSYHAAITAGGNNLWTYAARLVAQPSGTIIFNGAGSSGVLPPGQYRIVFSISATGQTQPIDGVPSIGWPALPGSGSLTAQLTLVGGVVEACCFSDGTCQNLLTAVCVVNGGMPQGPGSVCSGVTCPGGSCRGDADGDQMVGLADLAVLISFWGQTAPPAPPNADLDGNGVIGLGDVAEIIRNWGRACPYSPCGGSRRPLEG